MLSSFALFSRPAKRFIHIVVTWLDLAAPFLLLFRVFLLRFIFLPPTHARPHLPSLTASWCNLNSARNPRSCSTLPLAANCALWPSGRWSARRLFAPTPMPCACCSTVKWHQSSIRSTPTPLAMPSCARSATATHVHSPLPLQPPSCPHQPLTPRPRPPRRNLVWCLLFWRLCCRLAHCRIFSRHHGLLRLVRSLGSSYR